MILNGVIILSTVALMAQATSPLIKSKRQVTPRQVLRTIEEVSTSRGTPGASSTYGTSYLPEFGFAHNHYYGWRSKPNYGNPPETIWYHFRKAFVPAEVIFRSGLYQGELPTKYQFVGTNDEHCNQYSPWTILCEDLSGTPVKTRYEIRRCVVSDKINMAFKCFGIRSLGTSNSNSYVSLSNMRFWKKVGTNPVNTPKYGPGPDEY